MRGHIGRVVLFTVLSSVAAQAQTKYFGHDVEIYRPRLFEGLLKIDGKVRLSDVSISIEEVTVVAGVPVLIGSANSGGNMCNPPPFVVSFPPKQQPRIDGPLDACIPVKWTVSDDQITFQTAASPGMPGQRWHWTPQDGFKGKGPIEHAPEQSKGWSTLRERNVTHPADLFDYAEVAEPLNVLLGTDKRSFFNYLSGPGGVEYQGDVLIGKSCMAHNCPSAGTLLIADIPARQVYVAWKPEGKPIVVRPAIGTWTSLGRQTLKLWANQWK